jgi:hypothetical protein
MSAITSSGGWEKHRATEREMNTIKREKSGEEERLGSVRRPLSNKLKMAGPRQGTGAEGKDRTELDHTPGGMNWKFQRKDEREHKRKKEGDGNETK